MRYASIGSISHGTLRTEDLLDAFAYELEYHVQRNAELPLQERERLTNIVWDAREVEDFDSEEASDIVNELQDELQTFAAPYCYFGAHEGDGADFGYWPSMDAIEELPKISDPAEVEGMGEDCVFINDHGNVTVYGADGKMIWDCV